jgi:hypothetical protein
MARRWSDADDELVRTLPPTEAAHRTGWTLAAIHQRRYVLETDSLKRRWSEAEDRLLAKLPPDQAARYLKRSPDSIRSRRAFHGLAED